MMFKDKLQDLPKNPGCYLMKNKNDEIIYVGKAKNLSNRIKSYFIGSHNAKTERLVMDIFDFSYIITSSEKEALILEINLIKKHNPKYNILLTDDKTYPYVVVTNENHPRVFYTRDLKRKGKYFGPYPNVKAARITIDLLNKIYPLRKCNNIPKRECLYYHINNCLAPCIKKVDKKEYDAIIPKIISMLKGSTKSVIAELKLKMKEESDNLNFEKALEIRNIIGEIEVAIEKQKMEVDINNADIFNYSFKENYISIQVFHIRNFKVIERTGISLEYLDSPDLMFINFINQFYLVNNNPIPKEIITPLIEKDLIHEDLAKNIVIPKQGKRKELVDLVLVNINKELDNLILKAQRSFDVTVKAAIDLANLLNIKSAKVIEAYDNSNIQGEHAVSAMVVFKDGVKSLKDYRKFKVKTVVGSNDYLTFKEIIERRYSKLEKENYCDLIIMDGGKIQVSACLEVFEKLNISVPVVGLVKDDTHKTNLMWYNNNYIEINTKEHKNIFTLLKNIQEEVHRFAITFFRKTKSKDLLATKLDKIKGIGTVKKKQILNLLGETEFENELKKLKLNESQIQEILKLYSNF